PWRHQQIPYAGRGRDAGAGEAHDWPGVRHPRTHGGDRGLKGDHLSGVRKNCTHAQSARRSASTAPTPNNRRPSIWLVCKGPRTLLKEKPLLRLASPGPKAIQSAVSASAVTIRAAISARVLTKLRGSARNAPAKAKAIPT